jgi:nicotinamide mononucleotide (NMN) deamidase PncC
MAEYITNGQSNYGWSLTWDAAGRYPIIAKRRFATLADAQAFVDDISATATATEGLIISVIKDGVAKNNGVYYVHSVAMAEGETGVLVKVGGTETETAENYSAAVALSQTLVVGQLIKVLNAETTGEGEGALTYQAGFYIVEAPGKISALATSTGSDDEVGALKSRVDAIEGDYVTEKELEDAIKGIVIPEVPVKDVKYGEDSLLDENGVANLSDFAKASELEAYVPTAGYVAYSETEKSKLEGIAEGAEVNYVKSVGDNLSVDGEGKLTVDMSSKVDVDGYVAYSTEEKNKLAGIAEGAEVNVIETIKVNEVELTVTDKAVNIDLSNYVDKNNYVAYSTEEKNKLAGIAEGAEVNFVKSVGDNLSVDGEGKLTVSIPEVEVPFQSVAENDKVLTLNDGVLSSTLTYTRENVEGVDSLVLKGVNNEVIGSVPVADFVADGMLESVTPVEGTNKFLFTFKTGNGTTESFEVDFSKYVDTYNADGETIELGDNNTFKVKENVFDAYGAAEAAEAAAKSYADTELAKKADKATTLSEYGITDAYTSSEVDTKLDGKADKATTLAGYGITDAYTKDEVDAELAKKVDNDTFETVSGQVDTNKTNIEAITALIGDRAEGDVDTVFAKLTALANGKADKATTLAGYGITDAYTKDEADKKFLTGITIDEELNATSTNAIQNKAVFAEIEAVRDEISNVVAGDLSDALKAYVKSADVNTINDVALYNEGGAVKVEIAAGSGATVTTDTTNKVITVDTKISEASYNIIEVKNDGLYAAISISGDDVEGEN